MKWGECGLHVRRLVLMEWWNIDSVACQDVNWIHLSRDTDHRCANLNTVKNLRSEFATDFLRIDEWLQACREGLCSNKPVIFSPPTPLAAQSRAMASSFTSFLDHTQRHTTVGRTPLDEGSARRRDLYLTTHNTHKREASIPPIGF